MSTSRFDEITCEFTYRTYSAIGQVVCKYTLDVVDLPVELISVKVESVLLEMGIAAEHAHAAGVSLGMGENYRTEPNKYPAKAPVTYYGPYAYDARLNVFYSG